MQYELVSLDLNTGEHKADWFAKVCLGLGIRD